MKSCFLALALAAGCLLPGYARDKTNLVLNAVGPADGGAPVASRHGGVLLVYSAFEANADFNQRDPNRRQHTNYQLFAPDGRLLQRVHNRTNDPLQGPVPEELAPGRYRVVASANGYGQVVVPVIIEAGRRTVVHLEGGWSGDGRLSATNAVRLPGGELVGWKE